MDVGNQKPQISAPGIQDEVQLPEPGILDNLLSVFFPLRCVHCGASGAWLCPACARTLKTPGPSRCRQCGKPSLYDVPNCPECRGRRFPFLSASAAFCFQGAARSLVHALKYSGQRRLASFMADISCNFSGLTAAAKDATLTYVPLHRSKLLTRGYNQAGLYAQALSRRLNLPVRDLLTKHHPTPPQNQLGFNERRRNLAGSINLRPGASVDGERVLLIDDVYTTGSTAAACARALGEGLGVEVEVWTFARTVRD